MSFKHLFEKAQTLKSLSDQSAEQVGSVVESAEYQKQDIIKERRFIPAVDYTTASNFARYGSAEKYYGESLDRIYKTYPYDGSLRERLKWENESTEIDLYILNNLYPRRTGYGLLSADGWGTRNGTLENGYGLPNSLEYIYFKGGPNPNPDGMSPLYLQFTGSNYYDTGSNRTSNLKYDLSGDGVTVEFWMKKDAYASSLTTKEVLFDMWNGVAEGQAHYGRLSLALNSANEGGAVFLATLLSGSDGVSESSIGSSVTIADSAWHHYAFSFKNASAGITSRVYVDGALNQESTLGSDALSEVTGAMQATMGALVTTLGGGAQYAGKLSGSIDEFRYWKTQRSSQEIGRFWFTQVGGGVNNDPMPFMDTTEVANTNLGVYYKFNEGITGTSSVDSTVLDYSGRVSNGAWTGYSSDSRNTGSAIISSSAAIKEFEDPIIYSFDPAVVALRAQLVTSGSDHDASNAASIYKSLPAWITEEDTERGGVLHNVTQIMASYLDTLHLQIESLNKLKDIQYVSGSDKANVFAERLLMSTGLVAPELFVDASVLEKLADRSEDRVFEKSLTEIKNLIYQNIYNNLSYIYKSKGTEKAFRNLIRCFGVDDELIKINMYANNVEFDFTTNRTNQSYGKKYANFNSYASMDANVYQIRDPGDTTNTYGFISSSTHLTGGFAFTMEAEVLFPEKFTQSHDFYQDTNIISCSLFGVHATNTQISDTPGSENAQTNTVFPTDDATNFQVYAVRETKESPNVTFILKSSTGGKMPTLTSSMFYDVYNDNKWNFAVKISPSRYPWTAYVPTAPIANYDIEFQGVNVDAGVIVNSFNVTGTATAPGAAFITGSRRAFVGAHRTNMTGTILQRCDAKIGACRLWLDKLSQETIKAHALDPTNYGVADTGLYAFPFQATASYGDLPRINTLMLNWDFNQNTGSDANGGFRVADLSSGSATKASTQNSWLGNILYYQHPGSGSNFSASTSTVLDKDYVVASKQNLPESLESADMITVLSQQDDVEFSRTSRPQNYFLTFEKSMQQAISDQMINYFATLSDLNTLIGAPVNRYRSEYKGLKFLRQRFFESVSNEEIDFEKFFEYYKWIDGTLGVLLGQLAPVSLDFDPNIRTLIESHILERSKYQNKFPFLAQSDPDITGSIGTIATPIAVNSIINDAQGTGFESAQAPTKRVTGMPNISNLNNWKYDHAPLPTASWAAGARPQQDSGSLAWWQNRADRGGDAELMVLNATGGMPSGALADRQVLLNAIKSSNNRTLGRPYRFSGGGSVVLGGVARHPSQRKGVVYEATAPAGPTVGQGTYGAVPSNIMVAKSADVESLISSSDEYFPAQKVRYGFGMGVQSASYEVYERDADGATVAPFSLYSSSISDALSSEMSNFTGSTIITNMHADLASDQTDVPMQGPFTEKFVGGRQHRHIELNQSGSPDSISDPLTMANNFNGLDSRVNRPEGFRVQMGHEFTGSNSGSPWKASSGHLQVVSPQYPELDTAGGTTNLYDRPKANLPRGEHAKRPVNIKNILMTTASLSQSMSGTIDHNRIGNYTKNYEVIQTAGRSQNDPYFREGTFTFAPNPETPATRGRTVLMDPPTKSIYFDGSDDYATFGTVAAWEPIAGGASGNQKPFTVSTWIKPTTAFVNYEYIWTFGVYATGFRRFVYYGTTGKLMCGTGTGNYAYTTSNVVALDTWHHVVVTFAGGATAVPQIYVDGTLASTATANSTPGVALSTYGFTLAANGGGLGAVEGEQYMCDAAVWGRELSAAEVTTLYGEGRRINIVELVGDGLVSWWPLGDGKAILGDAVDTYNGTIHSANSSSWDGTATNLASTAITTDSPMVGGWGPTTNPSGTLDYALPIRTGSNSNQTVIVNRFSAPGGYDVRSQGYMDPAHEEFSVYNALPYRNRTVIDYGIPTSASAPASASIVAPLDQIDHPRGLNQLSTLHCGPFGADSAFGELTLSASQVGNSDGILGDGIVTSASFHKTQRNTKKRLKLARETRSIHFYPDDGDRLSLGAWDSTAWSNLIGGAGSNAKAFSISFWMNEGVLGAGSTGQGIFSDGSSGGNVKRGIYIQNSDNTLRFGIEGTQDGVVKSSGVVAAGSWIHVVCTFAGGDPGGSNTANYMKIYIDGVLDTTVVQQLNSPTDIYTGTTGNIWLGYFANTLNPVAASGQFAGNLSNMGIWNVELSAAEVSRIYNHHQLYDLAKMKIDNLAVWWRFSDSSIWKKPDDGVMNHRDSFNIYNVAPKAAEFFNAGFGCDLIAANGFDGYGTYQSLIPSSPSDWPIITGSVYDNLYEQHGVPNAERNYAWVTASLEADVPFYGFDQQIVPPDGATTAPKISEISAYVERGLTSPSGNYFPGRYPFQGRPSGTYGTADDAATSMNQLWEPNWTSLVTSASVNIAGFAYSPQVMRYANLDTHVLEPPALQENNKSLRISGSGHGISINGPAGGQGPNFLCGAASDWVQYAAPIAYSASATGRGNSVGPNSAWTIATWFKIDYSGSFINAIANTGSTLVAGSGENWPGSGSMDAAYREAMVMTLFSWTKPAGSGVVYTDAPVQLYMWPRVQVGQNNSSSVACWVPELIISGGAGDLSSSTGTSITSSPSKASMWITSSAWNLTTGRGGVFMPNTWYHLAVSYNGTDPSCVLHAGGKDRDYDAIKMYVNGVSMDGKGQVTSGTIFNNSSASQGLTYPAPGGQGSIALGNIGLPTIGYPFLGLINEFQVYNKVLSAPEVGELFERRGNILDNWEPKANLTNWYRMGNGGSRATNQFIEDVVGDAHAINTGTTGSSEVNPASEVISEYRIHTGSTTPGLAAHESSSYRQVWAHPVTGAWAGKYASGSNEYRYISGSRLSDSFVTFNHAMLNLNGPYQHPSWKQVRTGEHPVARALRHANLISIAEPPAMIPQFVEGGTDAINFLRGKSPNATIDYVEQPIDSRYKPFVAAFEDMSENPDRGNDVSLQVSYGNNMGYFSNNGLNNRLDLRPDVRNNQAFNEVQDYIDKTGDADMAVYASYGERVYPRSVNVYQTRVRTRPNYSIENIWNKDRPLRTGKFLNSQGMDDFVPTPQAPTGAVPSYAVDPSEFFFGIGAKLQSVNSLDASPWPLDAPQKYTLITSSIGLANSGSYNSTGYAIQNTASIAQKVSGGLAAIVTGAVPFALFSGEDQLGNGVRSLFQNLIGAGTGSGAGELQNTYSYFFSAGNAATILTVISNSCRPACSYIRPLPETPARVQGGYPYKAAQLVPANHTLMGFHPWVAQYQENLDPYQPYVDYSENLRLAGKDCSIVPEYRISEHLETYLGNETTEPASDGFLAKLGNLLDLTGSSLDSTTKDFYSVYATTDFLELFKVVDDELRGPRGTTEDDNIVRHGTTLQATAFTSFLPYKGFYPAERTVKLASYFSQSMGSFLPGTRSAPSFAINGGVESPAATPNQTLSRILLEPLFSPGILFNTIKSGLAVGNYIIRNTASNPGDLKQGEYCDSYDFDQLGALGIAAKRPGSQVYGAAAASASAWEAAGDATNNQHWAPLEGYSEFNFNSSASYQSSSVNSASFACLNVGHSSSAGIKAWMPIRFRQVAADTYNTIYTAATGSRFGYYLQKIPFEAIRRPQDYMSAKALSSGSEVVPPPSWSAGVLVNTASAAAAEPEGGLGAGWLYDTGVSMSSSIAASVRGVNSSVFSFSGEGTNGYDGSGSIVDVVSYGTLGNQSQNKIRWDGNVVNPMYELAIDNFLCETVNFFQDGLTSYVSKEEDAFRPVQKNKYYGMRVLLERSSDDIGNPTFGMYSRASAFGTPLALSGSRGSGITFAHLTPPYYNGLAYADIVFQAPYNDRPTLQDIVSTADVVYSRRIENNLQLSSSTNLSASCIGYVTGSDLKRDYDYVQMQLSASVNIFDKILAIPEGTSQQKVQWVVQTKFETPMFDFYDTPCLPHPTSSIVGGGAAAPIDVTSSTAPFQIRGMWHQYGRVPEPDKGVFLGIEDLPKKYHSEKHGAIEVESLRQVVGFGNSRSKRVGELSTSKTVREAVLVVPFRSVRGEREFIRLPRTIHLQRSAEFAQRARESGRTASVNYWEEQLSRYNRQIEILERYIVPPTLDFLINRSVRPVFFDAFEFTQTFSKKDLQNMWQNLPPESIQKMQKQSSTVNISDFFTDRIFGTGDIQWLVFKVKQRATKDYDILSKRGLTKDRPLVPASIESPYSFNWPYDYFSLVELLKIDENVEYVSKGLDTAPWEDPPPAPRLAASPGSDPTGQSRFVGDYTEAEATAILNDLNNNQED